MVLTLLINTFTILRELKGTINYRKSFSVLRTISTGNRMLFSPSQQLLQTYSSSTQTTTSHNSSRHNNFDRRLYARRAVNTSDSKLSVLKQYWETHIKKYLKYGTLGTVGIVVGLPLAVVGGIGYGAFALIRLMINRVRAYNAGTSLAEWQGIYFIQLFISVFFNQF